MNLLSHVQFEDPANDGLSGATWRFYLLREQLVLDEYVKWTRVTKRHGKKMGQYWSRLHARDCSMAKKDVPYTDFVGAKAKAAWLDQLRETVTVGFSV